MPSLPILTLDERVLSPRFGYVFYAGWLEPYESILGMLWKFVRANRFPALPWWLRSASAGRTRMKDLNPMQTRSTVVSSLGCCR